MYGTHKNAFKSPREKNYMEMLEIIVFHNP